MSKIEFKIARFPEDLQEVLCIFREYVKSPIESLDYQNYEEEFSTLPGKYSLPDGRILLAWHNSVVVGCAAIRKIDDSSCELKRVYVRPIARGMKVGKQLVEHLINESRFAGYSRMCLDVLPEFKTAQKLYELLGFVPSDPVSYNPVPGTKFLALDL